MGEVEYRNERVEVAAVRRVLERTQVLPTEHRGDDDRYLLSRDQLCVHHHTRHPAVPIEEGVDLRDEEHHVRGTRERVCQPARELVPGA